ncbi:hypothetical protein I3842_01G109400 [Carya illinoinensis]|uniref:GRF-type domain-containing protein n=1 Tax=Carya illinoinensis TaxID=32201 RepID=A0A922K3U3_CARIL|nr:hypothetical protein I3842_01G109400 [Carya illinoinensis]
MSSSHASSSSNTPPKCLCGEMARLKLSNTPRNPRRPFYSCPNYNRDGRPYCEYFLWADIKVKNEAKVSCERECHLEEKKEQLRKWEEEIQKREEELASDRDELHALINNDNNPRMRPCVYWGLAILLFCCWIGSRTIED